MKKLLFVVAFVANGVSATAQSEQTDSVVMNENLKEVAVVTQRRLTKATDTGLVYDLKHDKAARGMNLLEALRRVPTMTVDARGEIKVSGSGRFAIYLNGRPYRMAQSSPKEMLSSISAATIESVEVITQLDGRYDAEAGDAVINIITKKDALDGYSLTLNGGAATQPTANAGATLMAKKGKVDLSAGYNYDLNVQRDQPHYIDYEYFGEDGATALSARRDGTGNGRWTNHLARLMMDWVPDSLNALYIDGHALVNGASDKSVIFNRMNDVQTLSRAQGDVWQGTAEANMIYRNYYPGGKNQDRLTLGYRFTFNPDKRRQDYDLWTDYDPDVEASAQDCLRRRTNTDGRLLEHTFSADYALPLGKGHTLRLGAKEVLRSGNASSDYLQWNGNDWLPMSYENFGYDGGIGYTQNVSALYASYSGRVKKFLVNASLRGEFNHNAIRLTETGDETLRDFTSLIPRISLNYNPSQGNQLALSYSSSVARPTIAQLNPFVLLEGNIMGDQGNPELRPSRTHSLRGQFTHFAGKFVLQTSLTASRESNAILRNFTTDAVSGLILEKYGNFGCRDQLNASLYANYRPKPWLSLTASCSAAHNWFDCKEIDLKQNSWSWTFFNLADFTLPKGWTAGAQYGYVRNAPQLWTTFKDYHFYSFYINKSLLAGRLTLGFTADRPFQRFTPYEATIRTQYYRSFQHNDLRARSIGLKVVYTLNGGKRVTLQRDKSLQNEDQRTGVN